MSYEDTHTRASIDARACLQAAMAFDDIETATAFDDDRFSDEAMSDAYEWAIASGHLSDNPYRLDDAEQDARLEAHTEFVHRVTDQLARQLGRGLTATEASRLRASFEAVFGVDWSPSGLLEGARHRQQRFCRRNRFERAERELAIRREQLRRCAEAYKARRDAVRPLGIEGDPLVQWPRPFWGQVAVQKQRDGSCRYPVGANAPPTRRVPSPQSVVGPVGAMAA
jgi:hypothetical protein